MHVGFEIPRRIGYSAGEMDIKKIAFELKTGTPDSITSLLKALHGSQTDCSSKALFEVLYDLKFHKDLGVVFWAKKVLNKIEVNYKIRGVDPAHQAAENPEEEAAPPTPTAEEILAKISSDPGAVTVDELKVLCENPDQKVKDGLLTLLQAQPENTVLSFVTKQLGQSFPTEETLVVLMPFLRHEDTRVVANTIEGIQDIRSPKTFVVLSQLLNHADNRVRSNVAMAIGRYDREEAMAVVERMLTLAGKPNMQVSACHAIKVLREVQLFPGLVRLLGDPGLFREALDVFEAVPCEEAVRTLEDALGSVSEGQERDEIAASIARIRQAMQDAANLPKRKFAAWL